VIVTARASKGHAQEGPPSRLNRILDGFGSIDSPTSTGFAFRVMMPRNLSLPPYTMNPTAAFNTALPQVLRDTLRWSVTWTGIEA